MRIAVGTSLCIIAINSLTGFWKYQQVLSGAGMGVDWFVIGSFIVVGSIGSMGGSVISGRIPQAYLQRAFAFSARHGRLHLVAERPASADASIRCTSPGDGSADAPSKRQTSTPRSIVEKTDAQRSQSA